MLTQIGLLLSLSMNSQSANSSFSPGRIRVLLLGASDYPTIRKGISGAGIKLSGDRDVRLISKMFQERLGVPSSQIRVVTKATELTRQKILSAVQDWLIGGAKSGDALVFWWSGHGSSISLGPNMSTVQAIIPPSVQLVNESQIDSKTIVFSRELKAMFSKAVSKGIKDVTWFLDSCYSGLADRGEGVARYLPNSATLPTSHQVINDTLDAPTNWVYVSAGGKNQMVKEVRDADGKFTGPLTTSMLRLGARMSPSMSYRELGQELRRLALQSHFDHQPEVRGAIDRSLFGGYMAPNTWTFSVAEPGTSFVKLEAIDWLSKLDDKLPTILVGQLMGIQKGMRFNVVYADGSTQLHEVTRALASISQLSPLGPSVRKTYKNAKAKLTDSVGVPNLLVGIDKSVPISPIQKRELLSRLSAYPFIQVVPLADSNVVLNYRQNQLALNSTNSALLRTSPWPKGEISTMVGFIVNHFKAETVRSLDIVGPRLYDIESQTVPVSIVNSQLSNVLTGKRLEEPIESNEQFAVRIRVRYNNNTLNQIKTQDPIENPTQGNHLYISCIEVEPNGKVAQAFPKNSITPEDARIEIPRSGFSQWHYFCKRGLLVPESQIQRAISENRVVLFTPGQTLEKQGAYTLKVIAVPQPQDFGQLLTVGAKGASEPKGIGWVFASISGNYRRPLGKGEVANQSQDWAMSSLSILTKAR